MKIFDTPNTQWDGLKFAARYGYIPLEGKYYVNGEGKLVVPDDFPDEVPIFEAPDAPKPPKPTVDELIARIELLESDVTLLKAK